MNITTQKIALAQLKAQRKRLADYEAECEYYARQGYRPHYCIHGTDLWTDYDNICGGCEDGDPSPHELADFFRQAKELHMPYTVTDGILDEMVKLQKEALNISE